MTARCQRDEGTLTARPPGPWLPGLVLPDCTFQPLQRPAEPRAVPAAERSAAGHPLDSRYELVRRDAGALGHAGPADQIRDFRVDPRGGRDGLGHARHWLAERGRPHPNRVAAAPVADQGSAEADIAIPVTVAYKQLLSGKPAQAHPHRVHPRPSAWIMHRNQQQNTPGNRTETQSRLTSKSRLWRAGALAVGGG